ncbi:MAG: hypothetical protein A2600_11205 [Candidatus Lambdaproteobacteria bacterium RIFOXYD1_FULL_56_27]|uniref:histidine kinase n=1 Tax=Candidatus Lambdaproteobacteria bacterium RIFOXYD2_FULL_56_26 TaxID=1817773 RepID=A0A1F6GU95_9PROT|nr:MAG: hypothetical protein A2426_09245 [Candidatus Lambdaproteobacteria bacterium RIFOXYC1_FULL_56_13]OGH01727.1 MAG: hypothetical protein A2557_09130 [Candidatus Lambdaproteobacteria bacterium RIFOXYD2_FULL_56_26]OGH07612.1 MAG: hypothetical protein A2600_11205 [Candidatus Lambdaproteobacteria bacterium RIFOXYD1_FULL_56_27]
MNKEFILKRILTVEDDVTIRMNLVSYLEDSGYEVLEASNGSEGVRVFERERPDLVLVDLHMPELDGVSLLEQLRKLSSDTPLIVVSGASDIHEAISATQSGAWDFVLKPIRDMRELEHTISKAWERACLLKENHRYQRELEEQVQERTKKLNLAVQELGSSRELLANAERIAHLGSWSLEPQSGKMRWSEELYSLLGFNAQSTVPELAKLLEPVLGPDLPRLRQGFDLLIQQGLAFKLEHQIILPDGKNRVLLHQGEPGVHRPGTIDGVILDITERKEMEEQLRKSKELAEAASIAKNNFLATMSHELRTPLNGVLGMAQLLKSEGPDENTREWAQIILASGYALLNIIDEILDLTKIERQALEHRQEMFDPRQSFANLRQLYDALATSKHLSFNVWSEPSLPLWLLGDPDRLNQILTNLLSNAFKFTDHGGVKLTCEIESEDESRIWVRYTVEDTGVGIDEKMQAAVFDPFFQVDSTTTRRFGGVGLGLAIVRKITEALSGKLGINSALGKGTKFWVILPFGKVQSQLVEPPNLASSPKTFARVLVAEDDMINQEVLAAILRHLNCEYLLVKNGQEAIEALQGTKFDLVLMDLLMPLVNGYDATKRIRAWEEQYQLPKTPIYAVTAKNMLGDESLCLNVGMNGYLTKPIRIDELRTLIQQYSG